MCILISIKPKYADMIFSGENKYEIRRVIPSILKEHEEKKYGIDFYIYSSRPVKKIVGYFESFEADRIELDGTHCQQKNIYNAYKEDMKINFSDFRRYISDTNEIFFIKIRKYMKFICGIDPCEIFENFKPPQNFKYINSIEASSIIQEDMCNYSRSRRKGESNGR